MVLSWGTIQGTFGTQEVTLEEKRLAGLQTTGADFKIPSPEQKVLPRLTAAANPPFLSHKYA